MLRRARFPCVEFIEELFDVIDGHVFLRVVAAVLPSAASDLDGATVALLLSPLEVGDKLGYDLRDAYALLLWARLVCCRSEQENDEFLALVGFLPLLRWRNAWRSR